MVNDQILKSAMELYQVMLAIDDWNFQRLRLESGLSAHQMSRAVPLLRQLGLVENAPDAEAGLVPLSPHAALLALLESQNLELTRFGRLFAREQEAIRTILMEFQPIHSGRQATAQLEVIAGRNAVSAAMESASRTARHTVATIHPGPVDSKAELDRSLARYRAVLERGVHLRTIHPRGLAGLPRLAAYLHAMSAAGASVRLGRCLPTRLIIIDAAVVILPVAPPSTEPTVALVCDRHLVQFAEGMFENLWIASAQLETADAEPGKAPQGLHGEVLRLLASGMHDEGIARRLGVSVRTVGRLAAELMQRLNAESRFAAGVAAAQAGWLD